MNNNSLQRVLIRDSSTNRVSQGQVYEENVAEVLQNQVRFLVKSILVSSRSGEMHCHKLFLPVYQRTTFILATKK